LTLLLDVGFWCGEHKCSHGNSSENSHELHDGRDTMNESSVTEGETRGRFFGVAWHAAAPTLRIYKEPGAEAEFSESPRAQLVVQSGFVERGAEPPPL
jgi:hypothetical protein